MYDSNSTISASVAIVELACEDSLLRRQELSPGSITCRAVITTLRSGVSSMRTWPKSLLWRAVI